MGALGGACPRVWSPPRPQCPPVTSVVTDVRLSVDPQHSVSSRLSLLAILPGAVGLGSRLVFPRDELVRHLFYVNQLFGNICVCEAS